MIILGLILLLIGWLTGIHVLWIIGLILLLIGVILLIIGAASSSGVGGRRWWY